MTQQSHKEAAISFLRLVAAGKVREAFDAHAGPDFRHHNPEFRGDANSIAAGMEASAAQHPNMVLDVRHVFEEGDRVAVHSRVRLVPEGPDIAVVHIFRFAHDRVVELWDIAQQAPADSPNENGMF